MEIQQPTLQIRSIEEFNYQSKTVILRVDINSPIDPETKRIVNENRITMSLPTIRYLLEHEAKVAMIAQSELSSLLETAYLLRSPKNADRLLTALERALKRKIEPMTLDKLRLEVGLESEKA